MRYPDFYIVGAAKSGTTTLWDYLGRASGIFMTDDIKNKELGFFSNDYGIKSEEEYLSFFQNAKAEQIIGESCHAYLTSPESAEWIKKVVPDAKIIIVLRNPAKRAFSLYNWMVMHGYEWAKNFEKALEYEDKRKCSAEFKMNLPQEYFPNYEYYSSGLYYEQVKRYLDTFGVANCKIIIFEEFIKKPNEIIDEVLEFLAVKKTKMPSVEKVNESFSVYSARLQFYLKNKFLKQFLIRTVFPKKRYVIYKKLMKWNLNQKSMAKINPVTYTNLLNKYHPDIVKLGSLLNYNLFDIWK